jgi:hypothetical protein
LSELRDGEQRIVDGFRDVTVFTAVFGPPAKRTNVSFVGGLLTVPPANVLAGAQEKSPGMVGHA